VHIVATCWPHMTTQFAGADTVTVSLLKAECKLKYGDIVLAGNDVTFCNMLRHGSSESPLLPALRCCAQDCKVSNWSC